VVDAVAPPWYNLTAVKSTATTAHELDRALGATLGRGTFTAYYWRFI
jgi:hypothetical protein